MEFSTKVGRPETVKADAVVVGVHADGDADARRRRRSTPPAGGALKAAVKSGDMTGKRGTQLLLRGLKGVTAPRVLMVGLGGKADFTEKAYADAVRASVKAFGTAVKDAALAATDWKVKNRDVEWQARTLAITARESVFRSDELKSKRDPDGNGVDTVDLLLSGRDAAAERGTSSRHRDCQWHGSDQAARQPAAEHLHSDLSRGAGAQDRARVEAWRRGARGQAARSAEDGILPRRRPGLDAAARG